MLRFSPRSFSTFSMENELLSLLADDWLQVLEAHGTGTKQLTPVDLFATVGQVLKTQGCGTEASGRRLEKIEIVP